MLRSSDRPSVRRLRATGQAPQGLTTLAEGEEGPITTFVLGEEGTTLRFGEEGTSHFIGEEGTTLRFGEEGTTLRLGEEGSTLRFGEEGPITDPRVDDPMQGGGGGGPFGGF